MKFFLFFEQVNISELLFQYSSWFDNHIVLFVLLVIFRPVLNFTIGKNQIEYPTKGKNSSFLGLRSYSDIDHNFW